MNVEEKKRRRKMHAYNSVRALQYMFGQQKIPAQLTRIVGGARYWTLDIVLRQPELLPKALKINDSIALGAGAKTVISRRDGGVVRYDVSLPQRLWEAYTFSDVDAAAGHIGLGSGRVPIEVSLSRPHMMVLGESGSGKSVTVRAILYALMKMYTPDQLKVALVDPHRSIVEFDRCAHYMFDPAGTADEVESAVNLFHQELAKRKEMGEAVFRTSGLPKWLLACDETARSEVFGFGKNLNEGNLAKVADLVQEGRKFGIHCLLATQKVGESDMPHIFSMVGKRYVGQVSSASVSAHLSGRAAVDAHLLTGEGDFIGVDGSEASRFQVAQLDTKHLFELERGGGGPIPALGQYNFSPLAESYEPEPSAGRKKHEVEMSVLAHYIVNNYTASAANEQFGFGRRIHKRYKSSAAELVDQLRKLGMEFGK